MLKHASLYKTEIERNILNLAYTEEMFLYTGSLGYFMPNLENLDDGYRRYAIVDENEKLIGYFTYDIDFYSLSVRNFGLFSFDKGNKIIGIDIYKELKKLINDYHIHRIEWRMVGGNPVERHYDNFLKKYNGNKFILTDAIRDKQGNYHNDIIYEIILNK